MRRRGSLSLLTGWVVTLVLYATPADAQVLAAAVRPDPLSFTQLVDRATTAMQVKPQAALAYAQQAEGVAARISDLRQQQIAVATAKWLQGEALIRSDRTTQAAAVVKSALSAVDRFDRGSKLHGDLLMADAAVEEAAGRFQPAMNDYQNAHEIFHRIGAERSRAISLQSIGLIYQNANEFNRALYYYKLAEEVFSGDDSFSVASSNNRANALVSLGRFADAEREYTKTMILARKLGSPLLEARTLHNIAQAQILNGKIGAARLSLERGMQIARKPEAAYWLPFLEGVSADVALRQGKLDAALKIVERSFVGVDLAKTPPSFRDNHQTAYQIYKRLGNDRLALRHLEAFKRFDDEGNALTASTSAALMAARFDFANQNLRIETLKSGQLQRDVALSKAKARQAETLFASLLTLAVAVVIMLALYLRAVRRSRNDISAANDRLRIVNAELEKALLAKSQFLATTSHEIRTPLNGILGMTQVMLADPSLAAGQRERVTLVHGAGETMRALVDDLLDLAKIDAGVLKVEQHEFDLKALLADAVRFWHDQAAAKGLKIALENNAPARIIGDGGRLRQIVFNLVSNAIKFTPEGRVKVSGQIANGGNGEQLLIVVEDTGIGIPESAVETIFEKFHQLDAGRDRRFGGTGLGLAISRNLARAMDGDIEVAAADGGGTIFTVRLPLRRAALAAVDSTFTAQQPAGALRDCRLVVAGASPIAQSGLQAILRPRVAQLAVVSDDTELPALLRGGGFDLVLIEAGAMQTSSAGLSRLAMLVEEIKRAGARVAVLWSAPDAADRSQLASLDIDLVVAKPVSASALVAQLETLYPPVFAPADTMRRSAA